MKIDEKIGDTIVYFSILKRNEPKLKVEFKPKRSKVIKIIEIESEKCEDYIVILENDFVVNGTAKNITWFNESENQISLFDNGEL